MIVLRQFELYQYNFCISLSVSEQICVTGQFDIDLRKIHVPGQGVARTATKRPSRAYIQSICNPAERPRSVLTNTKLSILAARRQHSSQFQVKLPFFL